MWALVSHHVSNPQQVILRPELRALKVLGAAWLENSGANTSVPAAMLPRYSAAATLGKASRGWLSCERANRSFRRKRERAATSVGDVAARVSSTLGALELQGCRAGGADIAPISRLGKHIDMWPRSFGEFHPIGLAEVPKGRNMWLLDDPAARG